MTTIFESMPAAVARKCSAAPGVRCGWFQMIEERRGALKADRYPRRTTTDLGCSALPASREVIVYRGAPNGNEH